jgi:hypothetical protein
MQNEISEFREAIKETSLIKSFLTNTNYGKITLLFSKGSLVDIEYAPIFREVEYQPANTSVSNGK